MPWILNDRLTLTKERIADIAEGCRQVAALPDPVGELLWQKTRPNGLKIGLKRVPMGVIGIIYEARPNVTVDAAALCFKAFHSSMCLTKLMRAALAEEGLPENAINLVEDTDRETANAMMRLNGFLDVLIPRGGAGLIQAVVRNATGPVIETGTGNCHVYVDASADLAMASRILVNAKCQRISVCNAAESLLVHQKIAESFLPLAAKVLASDHVKLHGCPRTREILGDGILAATEEDYAREYLDYEMSVKVVDSLDEAITHINTYNSGHSECIVTESYTNAQRFLDEVDRHLHSKASRPRPYGPGGSDQPEVCDLWEWAGEITIGIERHTGAFSIRKTPLLFNLLYFSTLGSCAKDAASSSSVGM